MCRWLRYWIVAWLFFPLAGIAADARVFIPEPWLDAGLDQHLFPRFMFKSRVRLSATSDETKADFGLRPMAPDESGVHVANVDELMVGLVAEQASPKAMAVFAEWLKSDPGRAALLDFQLAGVPLFTTPKRVQPVVVEVALTGDVTRGKQLSELHCARCHVVDRSKPFGAIGNSPSFHAMRSFTDWLPTFSTFYGANPHRALIAIESIQDPHTDLRPVHIARIHLTLDDILDIVTLVSTLEPLDLGAPVQAR